MLEAGGERIDLEAGRRNRRLPRVPALGRRHLERRYAALWPCRRDRRRGTNRLLIHAALQPPPQDRCVAEQRDHLCENAGHAHALLLLDVRMLTSNSPAATLLHSHLAGLCAQA
jgi:hypothetical protein